jgi:hypothetical protein
MPGTPLSAKTAVTAQDNFIGFNIRWTDRAPADTTAAQEILDAARDRRIANGCLLVSEAWIAAGKYPARDLVFECSQIKWHERVIVARQRTYTLTVNGPPRGDVSAEAQKFFTLFEITL